MNENDYDEDGNNMVPCPICLDRHCPGNQFDRNGNKIGDGKCPMEDEFARDMELKQITDEFAKEFAPNGFIEEDEELVVPQIQNWLHTKFTSLTEQHQREKEAIVRALREEYGGDFLGDGYRVGKVLHKLNLL